MSSGPGLRSRAPLRLKNGMRTSLATSKPVTAPPSAENGRVGVPYQATAARNPGTRAAAGGSCIPALAPCNPLNFRRKTRGFGVRGYAGRMILWRQRWFGAGLEGHGGGMDLLEAKSRIAEALVESIFRRARDDVAPFRRGKSSPLRFGREDFSPDFRISQQLDAGEEHEYLVEVKYRP